jgi:FkbM family methyltransferase
MNETLYRKVKKLGFTPKHVAEVGVWMPESSNVLMFIEDGCRTDLFEPDPLCIEKIEARFSGYSNVHVHPNAIYHENTTLGLYRTNSSTFAQGLQASPALINDRYQPREEDLFHAEARKFSEFDDGTIDLLSIDTEGCEWYVIQTMVSRPMVISLETHGKKYRNPFAGEIQQWMNDNGYRVWYRDKSDTVYVRKELDVGFFSRWF